MSAPTPDTLVRLSETTLTVADLRADVRGRAVLDADGDEVGTVDDLLVDQGETKVRFLRVSHGGFLGIGAEHFLVPVEAVRDVTDEAVHIDRERSRLTDVPGYDPDVEEDPGYYGGLYGWWGYPPYGAPGYVYPGYPYF
jgi:sporulation protein YlmC with PRC-barrel domain